MKRALLFLSAVLMIAQWSYAAAGAYCSHEAERSGAVHWGHHSHTHKVQDRESDAPHPKGVFHGDCTFCHAAAVFGPQTFMAELPTLDRAPLNVAPTISLASRGPDIPDRPQW